TEPPNNQRTYDDMRLLVLTALVALSAAAPQYEYSAPRELDSAESVEVTAAPVVRSGYAAPRSLDSAESVEFIPILRDVRDHDEDGSHNFEIETGNGISISQSGDSYGNKQGVISFTHPDGTPFYMTFVADGNGFQPESAALPVAPAFPHPIPDFVLRQIEFARQEDEAAARAAASAPRASYSAPSSSEEDYNRKKREAPYAAARSLDSDESFEVIPILRDVRNHEEDGTHNFEFETANGIVVEESGDAYGNKQGVISFTHPDGTPFYMTFVANGDGFQPESSALPVAPAFPHPIPEFVLRQIEFARQEDEAAARAAASAPRASYSAPISSEEYN
ncbi:unnamed protein product, partial [Meganyctiphanes norvegica]